MLPELDYLDKFSEYGEFVFGDILLQAIKEIFQFPFMIQIKEDVRNIVSACCFLNAIAFMVLKLSGECALMRRESVGELVRTTYSHIIY